MEQEIQENDDKKNIRIDRFFSQKCVWFNKHHYFYLSNRQFFIAKIIIKKIAETNKTMISGRLVKEVRDEFNKNIDDLIVNKYQTNSVAIKQSEHKWLISKNVKTQKLRRHYLKVPVVEKMILRLAPTFIYFVQIGNAAWFAKGGHSPKIFSLNPYGRQIYNRILEEENIEK